MLITRSQRPRRTRSTTVASPPRHLRDALDLEPGAASVAAVPSVATSWKPSPASAAATGTSAGLSASRTERKAVPAVGSGRPAARSAFANAVGRSAALAITSPVARISGPSTGIGAREAGERQHGRLHAHLRGGALRRQAELGERARRRRAGTRRRRG